MVRRLVSVARSAPLPRAVNLCATGKPVQTLRVHGDQAAMWAFAGPLGDPQVVMSALHKTITL